MSKKTQEITPYQHVIHKTRYARWREEDKRRETFDETNARVLKFFEKHIKDKHGYAIPASEIKTLSKAMNNMEITPSMRVVATAGKALRSANMAAFNCTALPIDSPRSFSELLHTLATGAGVGFSVERKFIRNLPKVPEYLDDDDQIIVVADSREGWAKALLKLISALYEGRILRWDVSKVRPAGAPLKTFGGFASGPEPLVELFEHVVSVFKKAKGRRLTSVECFSIATFIAQTIVVGGVRRSATICLFDQDDAPMRNVKGAEAIMYVQADDGSWQPGPHAHYAMANISAVYTSKPSLLEFMATWKDLIKGRAGEPGIFNRAGALRHAKANGRRVEGSNGQEYVFLTNPCAEIFLRPHQACNLSTAVIRADDTLETLKEKVRLATVLGTWQSTITDFDYVRSVWKKTIDEDRLLGVCLTGFYDHPVLSTTSDECAEWLQELKKVAIETNKKEAKKLGIPQSQAVTSVKPAGNSGQLLNVASGIHPRRSRYMIRTIRQSATSPVTEFLKAQGVPWEISVQNTRDIVFSFPVKAPDEAKLVADVSAVQQCRHWLHVKKHYSMHTVSCTIYVRDHEWLDVAAWVYRNFNEITGLSFLPLDDTVYQQAPEQPITRVEYEEAMKAMPDIDWSKLRDFEERDTTEVSQEMACTGGSCEL